MKLLGETNMKWFRNLSISTKLIIGFMIMALIVGVVGVYGLICLSTETKSSEELFAQHGDTQGDLGYILGEFNNQRALDRDIVLDRNDDKTQIYVEKINESDQILQHYLSNYQTACVTEEEQNEFNQIEQKIKEFSEIRDQIVAAATEGNYDEAYRVLRDSSNTKIVSDTMALIEHTIDSNMETGAFLLQEQSDSANQAITIMIIVVAIAIILGIVMGIVVSRIISNPIKKLSVAADKLAQGNTDVDLNIDSKDEVGMLAVAFDGFINAIKKLITDANMLEQAALEGQLTTRADIEEHQGDYQKIIDGVNKTLDAVVAPFTEALGVMREMSNGNLKSTVTGEYKGDYAILKDTLNDTIAILNRYIEEISFVLGEMSQGNLDVDITSEYRGDFVTLKESINSIAYSLNQVMLDINTAAEQVASGTSQVSDGSQEISQGATEQASAIEELTATITQIAAQTKQNAMNANEANELAMQAKDNAVSGNDKMQEMLISMEDINTSSEGISRIIKVIDEIAFQTKILALNAAVEAARAGIHGKGFAVVAEEVRNLAARSADAAKETTTLIEDSIKKVAAGTKIANETADALESIVTGVDQAVQLVGGIAVASNEQATGVAQVNNGIEQLSQVVQTNSATAEESAAASEELSSQAEMLKDMVGKFQLNSAKTLTNDIQSNTSDEINEDNISPNQMKPKIMLSDDDFGKY